MKKILAILFSIAAIGGHAATVLLEDFEAAGGVNPGALNGQNGWSVSGGSALVQSAVVHQGTQALEISQATATRSVESDRDSLWIRFQARISAVPETSPAQPGMNTSVAFFVGTNQHLVAYSNQVPIDLGVPMPLNEWKQFDVYCDYGAMVWNLGMDGTTIGAGLALYSPETILVDSIQIANAGSAPAYFDHIDIADHEQAAGAADSDMDGVPDWWELKHFGGITACVAAAPSGNGGLTFRQTYIAGVDPFSFDPFLAGQAGSNGLRWTPQPGRLYTVERAPSLSSNFVAIASLSWPDDEYIDSAHEADPAGYYRLKVGM